MLVSALKYGLANLTRFSGRDGQAPFWLYVLMTFPLIFCAVAAVMFSEIASAMERAQEFAQANPDKATITRGPGSYRISINDPAYDMGLDTNFLFGGMLLIGAVAIILYAAAVCRRLHDRGYRGWWGVVPAVLFFASGGSMASVFGALPAEPDPATFFAIWLLTMTYNVSLIVLVIQCALPGKPEANRFGEVPPKTGI